MNNFDIYSDKELINFSPSVCVPRGEVKLLSASEMYEVCDIFLNAASCKIENRWPPSINYRNELARRLQWNCSTAWRACAEWKGLIQPALQKILQQDNYTHIHELTYWGSRAELETDIHNAALVTRRTVSFFASGNSKHLPKRTDVFAVPTRMNEFFGSVLAGRVSPVWMTTVDVERTTWLHDHLYPESPLRGL